MKNLEQASSPETARSINQERGKTAATEAVRLRRFLKVNVDDFLGYYPEEKIARDKKYVAATEKNIGKNSDTEVNLTQKLANDFENFFIFGVVTGDWLGSKEVNGVTAAAGATAKYDDYKHRIDAFSVLYYESERDHKNYSIAIGTDVTISGSHKTIMDKFERPHNESGLELPFGFSKLDYYTNGKVHKEMPLMPRYIIGISNYDVNDINETVATDHTGAKMFRLATAKNFINRFKVLSEMYVENQLYLARLPEERETPELKSAYNKLKIMDKKLSDALYAATKHLSLSKWPKRVHEEDYSDKNAFISAMEEAVREDSLSYFEENRAERLKKDAQDNSEPDDSHTDTYVQIMDCIKELKGEKTK